MAPGKLTNLARMTTPTAGTGTLTLGAAVPGFLTFANSGVLNGDVVSYGITDGNNSEVGTGTYSSTGPTLTRSVTKSTNADAAIALSGTAQVFVCIRSEDYVSRSGDTLTGDLTINKSSPTLYLNNADASSNIIYGRRNSFHRWGLILGNGSTESGGNAGSDFSLVRYADNGTSIGAVLAADRATGLLTTTGDPTAALGIATKQYVDSKPSGATISDAVPVAPVVGQFWWESDTGILWLYYNDGTSSQWVQANGTTAGSVSVSYVDTADNLRLLKSGDTMSGNLTITKTSPAIVLSKTASGQAADVYGTTNGIARWLVRLGDDVSESGGNAGSNFSIYRHNDAGVVVDSSLNINRATNQITTSLPILPRTTWTGAQQSAARQSVYAAPFDAMAFSGMQVNGSMRVNQDGVPGNVVNTFGAAPFDMWTCYIASAAGGSAQTGQGVQGSDFGVDAVSAGHTHALYLRADSAFPMNTNGDLAILRSNMDALKMARLAWGTPYAQPLSYGFKMWSTKAGTFFVRFCDAAVSIYYFKEHTIAAGTWTYFTGTIPGPTSGTWTSSGGAGMTFDLFVGGKSASRIDPNLGWQPNVQNQTTNSTNLLTAINDIIFLTGVTLLPGLDVPSSAQLPFVLPQYHHELMECMRYYEISHPRSLSFGGYTQTGNAYVSNYGYKVAKRKQPTITLFEQGMNGFQAVASASVNATMFGVEVERIATGITPYSYYLMSAKIDARI